jgi:hypothetical protein
MSKKGYREALLAVAYVVGALALLALLFLGTGCAAWHEHPTEIRAWAAVNRNETTIGHNPTGNILITQPLPWYLEASFLHVSSIPDFYDRGELNQVGIGVCVKVPMERC